MKEQFTDSWNMESMGRRFHAWMHDVLRSIGMRHPLDLGKLAISKNLLSKLRVSNTMPSGIE